MREWISVKERLPDNMQNIDIYHEIEGRITDCYFDETPPHWMEKPKVFSGLETAWLNITHWMPVPDSPSKELI